MIKATYWLCVIAVILFGFDTLAYALRLVVYRNKQYTLTNSVFKMFSVFIKMFVTFQAPMLGVLMDVSIAKEVMPVMDFRLILIASSVGVITAIIFMPTFLNLFPAIVAKVANTGSATAGVISSVRGASKYSLKELIRLPGKNALNDLVGIMKYKWLILASLAVQSVYSISMYSSYLASYLRSESRLSIAGFSGTVNAAASIILLVWLEPKIAVITDEVYKGDRSYVEMKQVVIILIITKLFGTVFGQLLLVPASQLIYHVYMFLVGLQ